MKKSSFMRAQENYLRAAKYVNEAKRDKTPLSREFLRVPYGLEVEGIGTQHPAASR